MVKHLTFEDKGQPPKFLEIKDQDLDWHQISRVGLQSSEGKNEFEP